MRADCCVARPPTEGVALSITSLPRSFRSGRAPGSRARNGLIRKGGRVRGLAVVAGGSGLQDHTRGATRCGARGGAGRSGSSGFARGVAIEKNGAAWDPAESSTLAVGEVGPEKGDRRHAELVKPENLPDSFDQYEVRLVADPMPAEEEFTCGQPEREDPLAAAARVEPATGVAQRAAVCVVEAGGDAVLQHSAPVPGPDLESVGGLRSDATAVEEWMMRVEGQPSDIGPKVGGGGWFGHRCSDRSLRPPDHLMECAVDVGIGDAVERLDQLDDIAAAARGEALPEVVAAVGDEGPRVVAAMDGTTTNPS
jgi:hypothetical protein